MGLKLCSHLHCETLPYFIENVHIFQQIVGAILKLIRMHKHKNNNSNIC